MEINYFFTGAMAFIWLGIFFACIHSNRKKSKVIWTQDLPVIGSMSWIRTFPGTEYNNSFSPGYFTDDNVQDEVIIRNNNFGCSLGYGAKSQGVMENKLIAIDFAKKPANNIDQAMIFLNLLNCSQNGSFCCLK